MTRRSEIIRVLNAPPGDWYGSSSREAKGAACRPASFGRAVAARAEIAAVYYSQRVAGDFYEFLRVGPSRVLFGLFDLAGRRKDTREILVAAQNTFRTIAPKLFAEKDFNEAEAMVGLCHEVNRTILEAADGIRSCPAFIGCYNEDLGTVCYTNAGHTPALLRDDSGITQLEASGLPLGIFSHATQSASTCALEPGAALLLVSRGIVEAEHDDQEFGLESAKQNFQEASALTAQNLCLAILQSAEKFMEAPPAHNDVTALVLLRHRATDRRESAQRGQSRAPTAALAKENKTPSHTPIGW